ncbi:hypothetical protein [Streptomyces sp. NPDC002851]
MDPAQSAERLAHCTARPRVEHRTFVLKDPRASGSPLDAPSIRGRVALPGPGGAVFSTGGNDFFPDVTVESWSAQPPPPDDGAWDVIEELDFTAPSGTVQVRDLQNAPAGGELELGPPGDYRLRACSRGRVQAAALIGDDLYYEGVEEWLLQVWPS